MDVRMSYRPPGWAQDALLALLVTFMQVQGTHSRSEADPATVLRPLSDPAQLGYVLLVASGLVLVLRRRFPAVVFTVTALVGLTYYLLDFPDGPGWVSLFVALYTLTATGDGRRSLVSAGVGVGVLTVGWLAAAADLEPRAALGWVFFRIGASVMSAALGESVRSRRVIAVEALARAELAERTREEEAHARVAQERLRIARDVHDTIAHAIAVINVQAGVSAHVIDQRPDSARQALVAIEQNSSRALQEMRVLLGVLRADDEAPFPVPGLNELDALADQARKAGLDIEFEQTSRPGSGVPGVVSATAYRIVQEALTNVVRHVGPTRVTVALVHRERHLEIIVADAGPGGAGMIAREGPAAGHGIRGMRERCELLGGHLEAGPATGAGFKVRAVLPLAATRVAPS